MCIRDRAKTDPLEDVYDRFAVIDTEDGEYAIWDNQTDDYYVDPEGVTEYLDVYKRQLHAYVEEHYQEGKTNYLFVDEVQMLSLIHISWAFMRC